MQWHCHNCQRLLCPLCKLQRGHHGHKVLPIAQAYQDLKVDQWELSKYHHLFCSPALLCLFQDKVTKEVNFILANQETIQSQITHLDDAIKQMEVNFFDFFMYLCKALETERPSGGQMLQCGSFEGGSVFGPLLDSPGQQYRGSPSTGSLRPRAGGGCSRASGCPDCGPGGLPLQEERGPLCSALGEEKSAGACGPDGLHTGAAQGARRPLLRAGRQDHSQQVAHSWVRRIWVDSDRRVLPPQVSESHREPPVFLPGGRSLLQTPSRRLVQRGSTDPRLGVHTR